MPTASGKKQVHQHTKKLSQVTSTAQTPNIVTPTTPSIDSTPVLHTSTSPTSPTIDFKAFIELADLDDVLRFCDAVTSTQEGRNLKLLWDRAFEAGLNQGRNEERGFRDEMYLRGKAQGIREAEEAASRVEIDFYRHRIEKGRTEE